MSDDDRSWTLPAACALAAFEAAVAIAVLLTGGWSAALARTLLQLAKLGLCRAVLARRAGAALLLFVWELVVVLAALVGPRIALWLRALNVTTAIGVIGLLALAVHLFPSASLPPSPPRPTP